MNTKPKVLVLCTGNSMRSQLAEGLLRHDLGEKIEVFSAGTHPCDVHPNTIEALAEIGVDTSSHRSKNVQEFVDHDFDLVITVCDSAKRNCPALPGARAMVHKGYPDPFDLAPGENLQVVFAHLRDRMREELAEIVRQKLSL